MFSLTKKIEFLANVLIIVVAMLLIVVLTREHLMVKSVGNEAAVGKASVGGKLPISDVDWNKNRQTLLLAISTTCRYCDESAGFYQRLLKENANTQIVAVMPQELTVGKKYLENHRLPVHEIRQLSLDTLGVTGTPTLILVDNNGIVRGWWVGKLSQSQETEVLLRLQQA